MSAHVAAWIRLERLQSVTALVVRVGLTAERHLQAHSHMHADSCLFEPANKNPQDPSGPCHAQKQRP